MPVTRRGRVARWLDRWRGDLRHALGARGAAAARTRLAYRYLGKRDRTESEVRRHLEAKDVDEVSIDGAVADARAPGLRRRRALRADVRRGPPQARRLGTGADRAPAAGARRRGEFVAAALAERDSAGELEAAVALLRRRCAATPRPTASASGRSGCSSARATTSSSRTTPCARSAPAGRPRRASPRPRGRGRAPNRGEKFSQ